MYACVVFFVRHSVGRILITSTTAYWGPTRYGLYGNTVEPVLKDRPIGQKILSLNTGGLW